MTNVTARHGYNAVHLGGREYTNGRWTPACRIQHDNSGGRTPSTLHPTKEAVTCKRCLKLVEKTSKCGASRYGTGDKVNLCTRTQAHTGNHRTAEGDEFTNWTEPVKQQTTSNLGRKLAKDHSLNFF